MSDDKFFKEFLQQASAHAPVIVDEAYLEFTEGLWSWSAVSLVREGANVLVFRTFDKIHGLAGLPIGYTLAPKKLAATLRDQGLGDAESLGRLNMVAASAALSDRDHTEKVRMIVAAERQKWLSLLEEQHIPHTRSVANFVFFDTGRPQLEMSTRMREQRVQVARAFPPYGDWIRISIGTPTENDVARRALRQALRTG